MIRYVHCILVLLFLLVRVSVQATHVSALFFLVSTTITYLTSAAIIDKQTIIKIMPMLLFEIRKSGLFVRIVMNLVVLLPTYSYYYPRWAAPLSRSAIVTPES